MKGMHDLVVNYIIQDKMKALVVYAPGDIRYMEYQKPVPGPEDVLVMVKYVGICGTDLAIYRGDINKSGSQKAIYPVRIGHEWSGIVEEVGNRVKRFKKDDKVVSETGVTCGTCDACMASKYMECRNGRAIGTLGNCWSGAFAEYILIPERHLYKLPSSIDLDEAALIEPAVIAYTAVKRSDITKESKVLIIGTGAIGLATVGIIKSMGDMNVTLSGRNTKKLQIAKEMGADIVVNIKNESLKKSIFQQTDGKGVDVVIETSGNPEVLEDCFDITSGHGVITLVGFYEQQLQGLSIDKLVMKCLRLQGSTSAYFIVPEIIRLMESGILNLRPIITDRIQFDEAAKRIDQLSRVSNDTVKMIVQI